MKEEQKTFGLTKQQVRLIDIFAISPFLYWASTKTDNKSVKYGLLIIATTTLLYNGINYLREKEK